MDLLGSVCGLEGGHLRRRQQLPSPSPPPTPHTHKRSFSHFAVQTPTKETGNPIAYEKGLVFYRDQLFERRLALTRG